MSVSLDLTGNNLIVDRVTADVTGDLTGDVSFPTASLENPGTNAGTPAAFDKAIKVSVNGTDYWLGVYDDND